VNGERAPNGEVYSNRQDAKKYDDKLLEPPRRQERHAVKKTLDRANNAIKSLLSSSVCCRATTAPLAGFARPANPYLIP
jgi:hypothetical protein